MAFQDDAFQDDAFQTEIPAEERRLILRVVETDYGAPGILVARCVDEDAAKYVSKAIGFGDPAPPPTGGQRPGSSKLVLMDIPIVRDQDDDAGKYAAVTGFSSGWNGAVIEKSEDGGGSWDRVATITDEATMGFADTVLATTSRPQTWDPVNTVDVLLIKGTSSSYTDLQVLNGSGAWLIGDEIVQARDSQSLGSGKFRLSMLLRGRKSTEWAVGAHVVRERVVFLSDGNFIRLDGSVNDIGKEVLYRAVSAGTLSENASRIKYTHTAAGLKPYTVVHVKGSRDGSNNLTGTFVRRTRIGGEWRDFFDVPVGETSEAYEVDILNVAETQILRIISVTSQSFAYTAAQQTADGLTPGDPVHLRIYQISALVARGFEAAAVV